jgi:hypothetical protein
MWISISLRISESQEKGLTTEDPEDHRGKPKIKGLVTVLVLAFLCVPLCASVVRPFDFRRWYSLLFTLFLHRSICGRVL